MRSLVFMAPVPPKRCILEPPPTAPQALNPQPQILKPQPSLNPKPPTPSPNFAWLRAACGSIVQARVAGGRCGGGAAVGCGEAGI